MLYLSLLIVKLKQQLFRFIPSLVLKLQLVKTAFWPLSNAIAPYFSQKLTALSSLINSYMANLPSFKSSVSTPTNDANSLLPLYISPVRLQRHAGIAIDVKTLKAFFQHSLLPKLNRHP